MKANRAMCEEQVKDYEGQLKGIHSFLKELKDKTDAHGTPPEQVEEDLTEAQHNIEYYEGEIARLKELLAESECTAYVLFKDDAGEWRWHLRAANGRIIADSGEGYRSKQDCLHGIALVQNSADAPIEEKQ